MNIYALHNDPNVKIQLIAGRDFDSHEGHHELGDVLPESAWQWPNLEEMTRTGFVYLWSGDEDYTWLPPHVFSAVMCKAEIDAELDKPLGARTAKLSVQEKVQDKPAPAKKSAAAEVAAAKKPA